MSIVNQKFGLPKNNNTKSVFDISVPILFDLLSQFIGIFLFFIDILSAAILKFG